MPEIVLIRGSQRTKGNSNLLLEQAVQGVKNNLSDIKKDLHIAQILPHKLDIRPCRGCMACDPEGQCVISDDMQSVYTVISRADIIFLATPVFFNGLPAHLKALVDRFQPLWASRNRNLKSPLGTKKRQGILIAAAGAPAYPDQFVGIEAVVRVFFQVLHAERKAQLTVDNTDNLPVSQRPKILKKALILGESLGLT